MSEKEQREQGKAEVVERTSKGQFAPGVSGNPAGRPRAAVNVILAQAREAALGILPKVIEQAENGDVASQKMLLELGMPKAKPMPEKMAILSGFPYEEAPRIQQAFIMGAMAGGMLSVEEARLYLDAIAGMKELPDHESPFDFDLGSKFGTELPKALKKALREAGA